MKQKQDCLQGKNSTKANEWLVKKKKEHVNKTQQTMLHNCRFNNTLSTVN
jgi:hypothetical protein